MIAVGVAATVTVLTVAGQIGLVQGAASAQTGPAQAGSAATQPTAPRSEPKSGDTTSSRKPAGDDWLTFSNDPPTSATAQRDDTSLPKDTGPGKRIVYDISAQRVWLVAASGKVRRTYLVSGGKDPTLLDPGRYAVYSMSREAVSYNHTSTMQYMVRFTTGDHAPIGFHDVPARADASLVQSRDQLGTPLSSGCIRQWVTDARALWEFATIETPVVVTA